MSYASILLAAGLLAVFTPAASAQWMWLPAPVYEPYYERTSVPRTHHRSVLVEHHAKPKLEFHKKPVFHVTAVSVDTERARIRSQVESFCGRHPKDVA